MINNPPTEKDPLELVIFCVYCNEKWTGEMMTDLSYSESCESCGGEINGTIDIICSNCKKLVYRKEI